ncbi:MAG: hypothetical protein JSW52_07175 [Candidatus Coatesbacteria bacterium]|nr:MAG: hypothetical protein JSW52_07175 [Candidatus Coatesbacteria bacterium]
MPNEPTVKCPNCKGDAEELASGFFHCPSCGAIFGEAVEAEKRAEPGDTAPKSGFDLQGIIRKFVRNPKPGLIILAIAVSAAVIGIVSFLGSIGSEEAETETPPEPRVAEERIEVNEPYTIVAPDGVTLYSEPDLWSSRIGLIPEDELITVVEKRQYWWRVVRGDASAGWAVYRFEDFEETGSGVEAGEPE